MQERRPSASRLIAILAIVALALVAIAPSALARGRGALGRTFTVTHDAVQTTLTNPGSDGHQLGDLRVTSIPVAVDGSSAVGQLDSTLTTVGIDQPNPGDEVRISVLIFSFNDYADQLVVNGTAAYPKAGSTLAAGTVVTRPITGGTGAFAGATGWAESEHLEDGSWRHTFHLASAGMRGMPQRPTRGMDGHPGMKGLSSPAPDASSAPAEITRRLLGSVDPDTAPGETLGLYWFDIPAGVALVPHYHPGYQVARIVSGVLTYTVIEGVTEVIRADGSTETVTNGATVTLTAGDTVVEHPDSHHYGVNKGTESVVIYAATLLVTGEPNAIPLPSASPAA
jgi:quercetin dioxygenase-like cupin family protein